MHRPSVSVNCDPLTALKFWLHMARVGNSCRRPSTCSRRTCARWTSTIDRYDLSPMAGLNHLRQIDVSRRETLEVMTCQGAHITLSLNWLDRQLNLWRKIYDLSR